MTRWVQATLGTLVAAAIGVCLLSSCGHTAATGGASSDASSPSATPQAVEKWATLADTERHFHLEYPSSWKVNTEVTAVAHYSMVFAALNSAGKENFTVREVQTAPGTWELNSDLIAQLVPAGTAYIDICWQEGPGGVQQFGPGIHEMGASDLSGLLKESKEAQVGELITQGFGFSKWGRDWNVAVYMHAPVTAALRDDVEKVLASFRFDGLPAGDAVWALGLAQKRLPKEADPEMYTRQGGSSLYYCGAQVSGDDVIVTFTKNLENTPAKSWTYRVTAKGEVIALESETNGGSPP